MAQTLRSRSQKEIEAQGASGMPTVRHRNHFSTSPTNNNEDNPRPSPQLQHKTMLSIDTQLNASPDRTLNRISPAYTTLASPKLHGGRRSAAFERFKKTKKYKMVLAGSIFTLAFCIAGLWITSNDLQQQSKSRHRTRVHRDSSGKITRFREKKRSESNNRVMEVYRPLPTRRTINKSKYKEKDQNQFEQHDSRADAGSEERKDDASADDGYGGDIPFLVPSSHVDSPSQDVDIRVFGYASRPRVIHCEFQFINANRHSYDDSSEATLITVNRLPAHEAKQLLSSNRYVSSYPDDDEYLSRRYDIKRNSKKYRVHEAEDFESDECKAKYDWQNKAFPNCNNLHEFELGQLTGMHGRAMREAVNVREGDGDEQVRYWAHGYWRDVWLVSKVIGNEEEIGVLKTLRKMHDFTDRNYDRHRKDALASERLSKSPYVVDIYAYCSNSAVFEYGDGGDIDSRIWPYDKKEKKHYVAELSSLEKIDIGKNTMLLIILAVMPNTSQCFSISSCPCDCRYP